MTDQSFFFFCLLLTKFVTKKYAIVVQQYREKNRKGEKNQARVTRENLLSNVFLIRTVQNPRSVVNSQSKGKLFELFFFIYLFSIFKKMEGLYKALFSFCWIKELIPTRNKRTRTGLSVNNLFFRCKHLC